MAQQDGQRVLYRPNALNPFYRELCGLVSKHMVFDQIIETMLKQVGDLKAVFVVGDYAKGLDAGTIEIAIVGDINIEYFSRIAKRAEQKLKRRFKILFFVDFNAFHAVGYRNMLKLIGE